MDIFQQLKDLSEQIKNLSEEIRIQSRKIDFLRSQNKALQEQLNKKDEKIKHYENILNKNSKNSGKPPSTDGFKKEVTKSLREKSGKKPGGQKGHKGYNLKMVSIPDQIIDHFPEVCSGCGNNLDEVPSESYDTRQVFDIPVIQMKAIEHRALIKTCPCCKVENKAPFPSEVSSKVQYGSQIKALVVYLMTYQLLPYERTRELIKDLLNHEISGGTLDNILKSCHGNLHEYEQQIRELFLTSDVIHFDETGLYLNGKRIWFHSASTKGWTYYFPHEKRGREAMEDMDILPKFKGRAIHDFWKSYLSFDCQHGLCNVHHLRNLTFCQEQENSSWAGEMKALLLKIKRSVDQARSEDRNELSEKERENFYSAYKHLLEKGLREHPLPVRKEKKRGRIKKSASRNLLERFDEYQEEVLIFMNDFKVPFDNNLAERDIRMTKVKQKISGCFRSKSGAECFSRIRGYISTTRKQGENLLSAIEQAILGNPMVPI